MSPRMYRAMPTMTKPTPSATPPTAMPTMAPTPRPPHGTTVSTTVTEAPSYCGVALTQAAVVDTAATLSNCPETDAALATTTEAEPAARPVEMVRLPPTCSAPVTCSGTVPESVTLVELISVTEPLKSSAPPNGTATLVTVV